MIKFKDFAEACDFLDQNTEGTKKFIKKHGLKKRDVPEKAGTENQFKSSMSKAKNGGYEGEEDEKAYKENNNPVLTNGSIPKKLADTFRIQSESTINLDEEGIELDEETQLLEIKLGPAQKVKRDLIYKRLKTQLFKYRKYGKKARSKMYSDATKQARGITEEQLDELSADTLKSYLKKNTNDRMSGNEDPEKGQKRFDGSLKATKRLSNDSSKRFVTRKPFNSTPPTMKEEELSELSYDTITSYQKKASNSKTNAAMNYTHHKDMADITKDTHPQTSNRHVNSAKGSLSIFNKRHKGLEKADNAINRLKDKLAKESREEALKLIAEKIIYSAISEERFTDEDLELMIADLEELLSMEGDE